MYARDVLLSCLRRWPLLLVLLLASGGAWYVAFTKIQPSYEAKASVVLVPPVNTEFPDTNLFLGLGGLRQSADVLSRSMSSEETARQIAQETSGGEYKIEPDVATSAPILVVTAQSKDPATADAVLEAVLKRLPANLRALQDAVHIKTSNQITQVPVSHTAKPDVVQKTRIRLLGLLAVLLVVLSVLMVGAVDGLLLRRATRRRQARDVRATQPVTPREPPPVSGGDAQSTPAMRAQVGVPAGPRSRQR